MQATYFEKFRARWTDMDFNQHMRNAAFLGCAEETRMRYFDSRGWSMQEFMQRQIGPVVLEDRITYKRELRLLEPFRVDIAMAGMSESTKLTKLRNCFYLEADNALAATVDSLILWMDLKARKPIQPPEELLSLLNLLTRTEDFSVLTKG